MAGEELSRLRLNETSNHATMKKRVEPEPPIISSTITIYGKVR